ncbi:MAG TPA: NACHT domain-containing protein [Amycolatopsis sp.]|nr:NACHT domain-containing protein [Amycolatopsis sp.]
MRQRKRRGQRGFELAWWAGLLGLAACLAVVAIVLLSAGGLAVASNVAQLVSIPLAVIAPAAALLAWRRRTRDPGPVTADRIAEAKSALAEAVARQWKTEAVIRALDDPDPIPVQWRPTSAEGIMDRPENITRRTMWITAASDDIEALAEEFRGLRRRRLVVLGGPGTGKTTLAVQLLRELLRTRRDGEPVPVLLPAAAWDTDACPRLHQWLSARIGQDYQASLTGQLAEALAVGGHVLPVLDGLDELPEEAQRKIVAALNRSLGGDDQLILTSRTEEFTNAVRATDDVLGSALVLEPDPLEPADIVAYLKQCRAGAAWQPVLDCLAEGRTPEAMTLAEATNTAWGLWLLRVVYLTAKADPSELLNREWFPTPEALRAHLFDQLVPAVVHARPPSDDPAEADLFRPSRQYDPDQVKGWLSYLAYRMDEYEATDDDSARPGVVRRFIAYCSELFDEHLWLSTEWDDDVSTRDFAWWTLARITSLVTLPVWVASVLMFSLVCEGLMVAGVLTGGPIKFGLPGLDWGLTVLALLFGPVFGFLLGNVFLAWSGQAPGFVNRVISIRALLLGYVAILVATLTTLFVVGGRKLVDVVVTGGGLASRLSYGSWSQTVDGGLFAQFSDSTWLRESLVGGIPLWIALLLGVAITALLPARDRNVATITPSTSWRADRNLSVIRCLVTGLLGGLSLGVEFGFIWGWPIGFFGGCLLGFVTGRHHAWFVFLLATMVLAVRGRLPLRLMTFLDDAHRLGLLRAVGPIYQFRHSELQDHLADAHFNESRVTFR